MFLLSVNCMVGNSVDNPKVSLVLAFCFLVSRFLNGDYFVQNGELAASCYN